MNTLSLQNLDQIRAIINNQGNNRVTLHAGDELLAQGNLNSGQVAQNQHWQLAGNSCGQLRAGAWQHNGQNDVENFQVANAVNQQNCELTFDLAGLTKQINLALVPGNAIMLI